MPDVACMDTTGSLQKQRGCAVRASRSLVHPTARLVVNEDVQDNNLKHSATPSCHEGHLEHARHGLAMKAHSQQADWVVKWSLMSCKVWTGVLP